MSKIKDINMLRERILNAVDDFEEGKIDKDHLLALSKENDSIISSLKSEMQYAILTNSEPNIPFYGESSGKTLEGKVIKKLI